VAKGVHGQVSEGWSEGVMWALAIVSLTIYKIN